MTKMRTTRERPSRCILYISMLFLSTFYQRNNNFNHNDSCGERGASSFFSSPFQPRVLMMVDGFLPSTINVKIHHYETFYNRYGCKSKSSSMRRFKRQKNGKIRDTNGVLARLLVHTDAGANNDSKGKQQVLETLWSYVDNLQRSRKMKGEMKAVYSLANFLESNKFHGDLGGGIPIQIKSMNDDKDSGHHKHEIQRSFTSGIDEAKDPILSHTEVLERALIPAIRQAGESNDYRVILRLISGGITFAKDNPILTPRIFGEALNALSQTQANASKLKSVWNTMIGNSNNSTSPNAVPMFLRSPPTAFELNTFLRAMAAHGKLKACIDIYQTYCVKKFGENKMSLSKVYIQPDAYTISILMSILTDSISRGQKMCDPVNFSTARTNQMSKNRLNMKGHQDIWSIQESLQSRMESLTYSTCWQWNTAVEILGNISNDENIGSGSRRQIVQWRNNHAYSSLLKLQEKAQDLCNGKISSSGIHKNGPELTMSILDDMIRNDVMPDAVTCTLAIKAMGRAVVYKNNIPSATTKCNEDETNLAVNFLERMKANPNLPQPNQYSYSAAIKACARSKDHQTALRLLEEMRMDHCSLNSSSIPLHGAGDTNIRTPPPNTWVYNAALLSLDNKKKTNFKQPKKIWRNKETEKLWSERNKEMNQQERTEVSLRLLDQMNDDNQLHGLDTKPDTVTYNTILGIGTFPHKFETNETKAANMTDIGISTIQNSSSVINRMKQEGINRDSITYCNAIDSSIHLDDVVDVLRMCLSDSSFVNAKSLKADASDMTSIFNTGLCTLTIGQDFTKFKNALTLMFEHQVPADDETLTMLIYAVGKHGKGTSLVNLFLLLEIIEDEQQSTNSSMIEELLESVGVFENGDEIHKVPILKEFHYAQAINVCLKENEFADAYTILSKMRAKGINPTTICMEGFALAYAQSAMDATVQEKKQRTSNEGSNVSVSLSRASSAYKIAMALVLPRSSTLGRVARACAMTGQWKLCRALLQSIHNNVLAPNDDGTSATISPRRLQTIRGTHSYILRECAKQGSVHAALHFTNDIQEFSKKIRTKRKPDIVDRKEKKKFSEILTDDEDIFKNLRIITNNYSSRTNVGMQPNDWMSVIQAASKSGHWRVCFNTLQFLRPYVERTKLGRDDDNAVSSSDEKYNQLTYALYAVTRSLESHSQDAWAVRAIEDWIEWSGRQPRIESVLSAVRVLATKGRAEEIRKLIDICLRKDLSISISKDSNLTYEEMLYVGAVTALHNNGHYDDADDFFMSGIQDKFLPFNFYRENGQFILDLHGLNVALAHSVVRIALRQQAATLAEEKSSQTDMMIITGKGRNSEFRLQPILRPEVQRMLVEEFYPPLNTMSVPGNIGALTILAQDIAAWQEQQQQQKGIRMLKLASVLRNLSSQERLKEIISMKLDSENNHSD